MRILVAVLVVTLVLVLAGMVVMSTTNETTHAPLARMVSHWG